jgi:energy-coupling factor transport system ATP-binding protein
MAHFEIKDLSFSYPVSKDKLALDHINLNIEKGEYIAVCGKSGSGKTTLLKHLKSTLAPHGNVSGEIFFEGKPLKDADLREQSSKIGYVMQNPDNQIIGSVVEEDVGFGPENMGVPTMDIWKRVNESLEKTGMTAYRHHSPNKLSGGQKQRVAIAGVMAMRPKCIVLDEPTAMLDPNGRKEVLAAVHQLNKQENVTVVLITHYMEEVIDADHVIVMDDGHVVMEGTPREIFSQVETLKKYRLDVPQVTLLAHELKQSGVELPDGILTTEELVNALCQ